MLSFERRRARPVHVIIPFYKNPGLVGPLFQSLSECSQELNDTDCAVIAINDSPGHSVLSVTLEAAVQQLNVSVPCANIRNETNQGFIKSVNIAFRRALEAGADVILLNSDTVVFPGAFSEIRRVAYLDSMIGFVSPRSNNATICSLPQQAYFHQLPPDRAYESFREICSYLPEYHYVPTAVGFCLFIKFDILNEFGLFDEQYGKGYNEENDLIMRANRYGFRAALANHAFVYHIGEQSFGASETPKAIHEDQNSKLLRTRYPEYLDRIVEYQNSAHFAAERLLKGLIPDIDNRIDVVIDCSYFGAHHNGTFTATRRIISHAAEDWRDKFNLFVMASSEAAEFHRFYSLPGVVVVPVDTTDVFGIAFRFGQPFDIECILRLSRLAPINVYAMLDTIAWDCLYLNRDNLDDLWRSVAQYADGILYISDFSCEQFHRRFPVRQGMAEKTSYLSLSPDEYGSNNASSAGSQKGSWLLVVGNSFSHKYVEPTVNALSRAFPRTRIVALGTLENPPQNVTVYRSGHLSDGAIHALFAGARAVVFPSTYEGFGMPVMEALSHRQKVFVRDNELNRAMHERLGQTRNMVLYDSTKSLVKLLDSADATLWVDDVESYGRQHSWACHTKQVRDLLEQCLARFSYEGTLMPRLWFWRVARQVHRSPLATINERESEIADLRRVLTDREARIRELLNSLSWTITAPLRRIASLWMKPRS